MGIHDNICGLLLKTMKLQKNLYQPIVFSSSQNQHMANNTPTTMLQTQLYILSTEKDLTLIPHISVVLEGTHPVNELYCVTCLELQKLTDTGYCIALLIIMEDESIRCRIDVQCQIDILFLWLIRHLMHLLGSIFQHWVWIASTYPRTTKRKTVHVFI